MPDTARFQRKMSAMRTEVQEAMRRAIERWADRVVAEMRLLLVARWPRLAAVTVVDWTWGEAPAGSITIQSFGRGETDAIMVTVYARARSGSGVSATWFEFGTAPRVQKTTGRRTGQIPAGPFFFPVYRANKRRVRSGLQSALRTAVRKINAS